MTGFESRSSGIGCDRSANCATTYTFLLRFTMIWTHQFMLNGWSMYRAPTLSPLNNQCNQIGRFMKFLGNKISNKSGPNDCGNFSGYFAAVDPFWATFDYLCFECFVLVLKNTIFPLAIIQKGFELFSLVLSPRRKITEMDKM